MAARPNVVLIVTDQHRLDHTGFGGNAVVRTPHLDALAARATSFTAATRLRTDSDRPPRAATESRSGLQPLRLRIAMTRATSTPASALSLTTRVLGAGTTILTREGE